MDTLVRLQNVSLAYRKKASFFKQSSRFEVLKSISLEIFKGETLGFLGTNGSGKSTLLQIIAGIIRPDSGVVENYNASIFLLNLGAGFNVNLSGYKNTIFIGMLMGHSRSDMISYLDTIKTYSELHDYFYEPVRTYSTGMRGRLGFSIGITMIPDILLIDETLSVGDQTFRKKAEATMRAKLTSSQTCVFVSHSEDQIKRLCSRAVLLHKGSLIFSGATDAVIHKYIVLLKDRKV